MKAFSFSALMLRRRSVWEAADSGVLLWRSNIAYLIPFYVAPVLIAAVALRLILPDNLRFVSYLALWWFKPLFERLALNVVSSRFFSGGSEPPLAVSSDLFQTYPPTRLGELCKGIWQMRWGLSGDLLWRRFFPGRSASMPIRVLERSGGEQFRQRKRSLASGGLDFCVLVTFLCLVLEAVLLAGKVSFTIMILQVFFPQGIDLLWNNMEMVELFIFAAFCFNYILVGSLYVCMGFGLYINSRVEVEGWDLQLLFQKFAARPGGRSAARRGAGLALLLCLFLMLPQTAYGDSQALPSPDPRHLEMLEEILASPDFGEFSDGWGIGFRPRTAREARREMPAFNMPNLENIRQAFGYIVRGMAILALAVFVGFAVVYWYRAYWKNQRTGGGVQSGRKNYAPLQFSTASPESLFACAEDFFRQGNQRQAWAACLAGCIAACSKYRRVSFPAAATEYGCLDLVRRKMPEEAAGFGELVRNWILFAYGGRHPADAAFEQALSYGRSLLQAQSVQWRHDES